MRKEKQLLLDEIKHKIESSTALLVTSYDKLSPTLSWDFAQELRKKDSSYEVVKKRIFIKAAQEAGVTLADESLEGNIGVVFIKGDTTDTTKTVFQFNKEREQFLKVLSGNFEGTVYSAEEVQALSTLPSKDEMRAQFLGLLEAPMAQTLSVMQSLLTSVMHCLENKINKEEKTG